MTEYVMVPVPDEFVEEVTRHLQWLTNTGDRPELEAETVAAAVRSLDDDCRTLLSFVAEAALNGDQAGIPQLGAMLGCGEREVLGTVLEINQRMRTAGAPVALMPQKAPGAATPEPKDQIIMIAAGAARSIVAALQLESADGAQLSEA